MNTPKFIVRRGAVWSHEIEIYFGVQYDDGGIAVASPVSTTLHKPDEAVPLDRPPMLSFHDRESGCLTSLMDQLWQLGIRPSDVGTPGHLEATKAHLADMRKLVSKQLGVEL